MPYTLYYRHIPYYYIYNTNSTKYAINIYYIPLMAEGHNSDPSEKTIGTLPPMPNPPVI